MEKKCDMLEQKMRKELEALDEKYKGNAEMSETDLKRIDMLYHALKSKATYDAMKEAEEYSEGGMSGYRGRNAATGRYMSMDGGNSYADGYSQGYSEGMRQGMSGHVPMYPPDRRW